MLYLVNVVARVERRNRTIRSRRHKLADFLGAAVTRNKYTFARSRAVFVRYYIARFVDVNEVCKTFVVRHLTNADKGALCVHYDVFVRNGVFKAEGGKFIVADKLFER